MKKPSNRTIAAWIIWRLGTDGATETRQLNRTLASQFNTTKQRISGIISFLVRSGNVSIIRNKPHSEIYL